MIQSAPPSSFVAVLLTGVLATPVLGVQTDTTPPQPPLLSEFHFEDGAESRWELPRRYREVSGLALSPDGRLFAHNDELAIIFQINLQTGDLIKAFAMGDRSAAGDFEGIAIAEGRFYLVTSDGRIYESQEGEDGDRLLYNTYGTSAGRACEIEGLAYNPDTRNLIMMCKTLHAESLHGTITLFKWSLQTHTMAPDSILSIPLLRITSRIENDEFNPSGIVRDPRTGRLLIVAARQAAIIEVSPSGGVIATHEFRNRDHRQLEGIELTTDGRLVLADEGRNGRAHVTVYRSRPNQ